MSPLEQGGGHASSWLDQRHYADLDPRAERALRAAGLSWHDEAEAERRLAEAERLAPLHLAVTVAQYRYRLYKHRFREAEVFARRCLALLSAELGIPQDPLQVTMAHAEFAAPSSRLRLWLFALQAHGYVLLRCGRHTEGMDALRRVMELDSSDQTKTRVLVDVIARAGRDEDGV
jgi:hypothetical protein